ncbi:hypothetical protein Tco_0529711 [Tanacetum coccineum]
MNIHTTLHRIPLGCYGLSSCTKGPWNSDVINLVDLSNSFEALKENDTIFKNVGTSIAGNVGNIVKDATKAVEESDSDVDDVYDKTAQFMTCGGAKCSLRCGFEEL